jgi:hypothetical protein
MTKVPVLFVIFNRPDIAYKSFLEIKKYQPTNLYIAADGPRKEKFDEVNLCNETRLKIINSIDWNCNIHQLFRDINIGVDKNVYEAINWMFETEKWGVIIEDDCIISQDFFYLCESAFPKYEHEEVVAHICANNTKPLTQKSSKIEFVNFPTSWGWGTWREKWYNIMDIEMTGYKDVTLFDTIHKFGLLRGCMYFKYWEYAYRHREELKTWDTIWQYNILVNNYLCILPCVNLAINNGIGTSEGSHYKIGDNNYYKNSQFGNLVKPYLWPKNFDVDKSVRKREHTEFIKLRLWGIFNKLKKLY